MLEGSCVCYEQTVFCCKFEVNNNINQHSIEFENKEGNVASSHGWSLAKAKPSSPNAIRLEEDHFQLTCSHTH
ncbi:hypothetical protein Syun_015239 [Stephania yunnanensis]|uniref:Uncharacterized protein n=1 Tax=Stephania yunnanensis TaxID=152371 RepID=A0AAP0PAE4_9MAGN